MFDDSGRRRVEQRRKAAEPEPEVTRRPRHEAERRCITRFEYGRCNAWWVRFQRAGKLVRSRMFADSAHGGKDGSLQAAIAWRDKVAPTVPRPLKAPRPPGSGRVYRDVRSYPDLGTGKLVYYACWAVWLRLVDGRAASTAYSIRKHGDKRARQMARDWLKARRGT